MCKKSTIHNKWKVMLGLYASNFIVWHFTIFQLLYNPLTFLLGTVSPERPSVVDGLRTVALKLEFGVSHNQTFERTIAVHFTNPFHVSTRVADKCSDGTLLLQVILHSQVKACLTIHDAWLDLQDGFAHGGKGDGRPTPAFFPLAVPAASRAGILFSIFLKTTTAEGNYSFIWIIQVCHHLHVLFRGIFVKFGFDFILSKCHGILEIIYH